VDARCGSVGQHGGRRPARPGPPRQGPPAAPGLLPARAPGRRVRSCTPNPCLGACPHAYASHAAEHAGSTVGLACEACQPAQRCGLGRVQPWRAPACQHARPASTHVRNAAHNTRLLCSAYDRAALYICGPSAALNFPDTDYAQDAFLQVRCGAAVRAAQGAGVAPHVCALCIRGLLCCRGPSRPWLLDRAMVWQTSRRSLCAARRSTAACPRWTL